MDADQQFLLSIFKIVGASITITFLGFTGCTMHQDYRISEMTKNGVSAIAASCAIAPAHSDKQSCVLQSATK